MLSKQLEFKHMESKLDRLENMCTKLHSSMSNSLINIRGRNTYVRFEIPSISYGIKFEKIWDEIDWEVL